MDVQDILDFAKKKSTEYGKECTYKDMLRVVKPHIRAKLLVGRDYYLCECGCRCRPLIPSIDKREGLTLCEEISQCPHCKAWLTTFRYAAISALYGVEPIGYSTFSHKKEIGLERKAAELAVSILYKNKITQWEYNVLISVLTHRNGGPRAHRNQHSPISQLLSEVRAQNRLEPYTGPSLIDDDVNVEV